MMPSTATNRERLFACTGRTLLNCGGLTAASEQERARERATAGRGDADLRIPGYLALPRFAPELDARLVQEAVAVQAARGELTAVGVEREDTVPGDALAAFDEGPGLALAAEAHRLEPR